MSKKTSKPNKAVTAQDVAAKAGVSRTQVSYVLNNKFLSHVSEENKLKILKAADDLGYQPHSSAQTLRRGYSQEFSIFFPAPYTPRINRLISTIHETGLEEGFSPIQYSFNSYEHQERMELALHTMVSRKPYGVFCSLLDISRKEIDYMMNKGVKAVLVWDIEPHYDLTTIFIPVHKLGEIAADLFIRKNYDHVGILKPSDPIQQRAFQLKLDGFQSRWPEEKGADLSIMDWPVDSFRPSLDSARRFLQDFLATGKPLPRAVYAYSDDYALPFMAALREKGCRIPEDIAILGTDNNRYAEIAYPPLSTIQFDSNELGIKTVEAMNRLIKEGPHSPVTISTEPMLIEREST